VRQVHLVAFGLVLVLQEKYRLVHRADGAGNVFLEHPDQVFALALHFQLAANLVGIHLPQHRAPDHGNQEQAEQWNHPFQVQHAKPVLKQPGNPRFSCFISLPPAVSVGNQNLVLSVWQVLQ
jgi:hypothetical protein